jgi:hypothetical protein
MRPRRDPRARAWARGGLPPSLGLGELPRAHRGESASIVKAIPASGRLTMAKVER